MLASVARGQAARQEANRRRAQEADEREKLVRLLQPDDPSPPPTQRGTGKTASTTTTSKEVDPTRMLTFDKGHGLSTALEDGVASNHEVDGAIADEKTAPLSTTTAAPGVLRLERAVTIDGTEVHLTADVKGVDGSGNPLEMLLVAVDKKAHRSSTLSLEAADIQSIVRGEQAGAHSGPGGNGKESAGGGGGGGGASLGPREMLSAVLKTLTVFNSRRKGLFILSYKGKKVVAPH